MRRGRRRVKRAGGRGYALAHGAGGRGGEEGGGGAWLGLGERVGALVAQLLDERPAKLQIAYAGKLLELDAEPLRAAVVKGLLETFSAERVNFVNALAIARSRGLVIEERRETEAARYNALLT